MPAGAKTSGGRPKTSPVEKLRRICLALPGTEEKIAWGEPTWRVKGKIFAMLDDHHHGAEHLSVHCSASEGVQEALVTAEPEHYFRPPYVGGKGWLGIHLDTGLDWATVAALIEQAHDTTAAKRPKH